MDPVDVVDGLCEGVGIIGGIENEKEEREWERLGGGKHYVLGGDGSGEAVELVEGRGAYCGGWPGAFSSVFSSWT